MEYRNYHIFLESREQISERSSVWSRINLRNSKTHRAFVSLFPQFRYLVKIWERCQILRRCRRALFRLAYPARRIMVDPDPKVREASPESYVSIKASWSNVKKHRSANNAERVSENVKKRGEKRGKTTRWRIPGRFQNGPSQTHINWSCWHESLYILIVADDNAAFTAPRSFSFFPLLPVNSLPFPPFPLFSAYANAYHPLAAVNSSDARARSGPVFESENKRKDTPFREKEFFPRMCFHSLVFLITV